MTTDEYSGMSRQDLRMEVIHWRGRAEVAELDRGELGKLCGEVEKRAEGVASIPEPLRDQLRAAARWAALPADPDKCIASRQQLDFLAAERNRFQNESGMRLTRIGVLANRVEELEEDRKEWRERERFLETRTRELEDAMLELDKLLEGPEGLSRVRIHIATALMHSGRSRESQGLMAELIVVRRHVHDLNADREELRRLLLDVAKFGVTAEALEAFRRAVGDPEWEP